MKWSPQPKPPCTRPDCDKPMRQWGYCPNHAALFERNGVPYRRDEIDELAAAEQAEREMNEALATDPPVIYWIPNRRGVSAGVVIHDPHTERSNRRFAS